MCWFEMRIMDFLLPRVGFSGAHHHLAAGPWPFFSPTASHRKVHEIESWLRGLRLVLLQHCLQTTLPSLAPLFAARIRRPGYVRVGVFLRSVDCFRIRCHDSSLLLHVSSWLRLQSLFSLSIASHTMIDKFRVRRICVLEALFSLPQRLTRCFARSPTRPSWNHQVAASTARLSSNGIPFFRWHFKFAALD